jgi:DNA-binding LacI/PurR family transcriptional regulator
VVVESAGPERRPTLTDLARTAGVSVALASIVMRDAPGASEATRARVKIIADELGYRPDRRAKLLRQTRSRLLGVTFEVRQAFHGDLIEGIYAAAEPAGYGVLLSGVAPGRSEARAIAALQDDRCEALILLGPRTATGRLNDVAKRQPVVVVARTVRSAAIECVRVDDVVGMDLAVGHLADLGHRRIAYLDGRSAPGGRERLRGFEMAVARLGLTGAVVLPGGPAEEDGVGAAAALLPRVGEITAAIGFNDRCATGVLDTFVRAGIAVPDQFSIVGYDDSRLSRISYIDLTTVGQDPVELARRSVERVVARLDHGATDRQDQLVEPVLRIRGTSSPCRSSA